LKGVLAAALALLGVLMSMFIAMETSLHAPAQMKGGEGIGEIPQIHSLSYLFKEQKGARHMKNTCTTTLAILSVFALLAGLALVQPALAQAESKGRIFEGELTKVDSATKTLSVKNSKGMEMEFLYTEQTQISGAEGGVEGLATKSGAQVRVHFDAASKTATKIEVRTHQQ
jgi:hypothetical protein